MMDEKKRLDILDKYFGQSDAQQRLTGLMEVLSSFFDVPVSLVTLIGESRQTFQEKFGTDLTGTPREVAFCNTVVANDAPLIVEDASTHPDFEHNPLVTDDPNIRFYAGVPLRIEDAPLGAVCLIDTKTRTLSEEKLNLLTKIAELVGVHYQLLYEQKEHQQELGLIDNSPIVLMHWQFKNGLKLLYASKNVERVLGVSQQQLLENQFRFEDFLSENSRDELNFTLQNHVQGLASHECQLELLLPSRTLWLRMISTGSFDEAGKLTSVQAFITDNTSQKYTEDKLSRTNQQMRLLLEASELGTWDWNLVADVNKVNKRWCTMLGLEYEEYDGSSMLFRQLLHPSDSARVEDVLNRHLKGEVDVYTTNYRMRHRAGHWVWVETYGKVVERDESGKPVRLAGTHRDISDRMESELQERKQKQLLKFINKAQAIYLRELNLADACQKVLPELTEIADSQMAFIARLNKEDGVKMQILAITELQWDEQSREFVERFRQGNLYFDNFDNLFGEVIKTSSVVISNDTKAHPASIGTPRGHPRINRFLGLPIKLKGELVGMVGLANKFNDYKAKDAEFLRPLLDALGSLYYAVELDAARQKAEHRLKELALTDSLTELPNRRAFVEKSNMVEQAKRDYVIGILDIDFFKKVNDSLGHEAGDQVLKFAARMMRESFRSDDFIARMGGEEFAFFMELTELTDAQAKLQEVCQTIADTPIKLAEKEISITVSIGAIAVQTGNTAPLSDMLFKADAALYKAKNSGRNQVQWWTEEMDETMVPLKSAADSKRS